MREFKFRAYEFGTMYYQVRVGGMFDGIATSPTTWNGSDWVNLTGGEHTKVMEYTGLKDKYNKEIYEGDIIKLHWINGDVKPYIVKYCDDCAYYLLESAYDELELDTFCGYSQAQLEVIGNIYEGELQ